MAFVHGKDSSFSIVDASSADQDLSSYIDNVPQSVTRAMSEVTAFGDKGQRFIPGLENASFEVSGHFDTTDTTGPHDVLTGLYKKEDAPTKWTYGPAGTATGTPRVSANAWVSGYNITSVVAEKVSFTATLQMDGTVTYDEFT